MRLLFWHVFMKLLKGWFPEEYHSTGTEYPALCREFQKEALSGPRYDQVSPSREELLFRAMGS